MKMTLKTEIDIKFTVAYFENEEGGMSTESFGNTCDTLEEALEILRVAQLTEPKSDWVIETRATFKAVRG